MREFPSENPRETMDDYVRGEIRRAIVETLAWVVDVVPELPETFFDPIPLDIHTELCEELEKAEVA